MSQEVTLSPHRHTMERLEQIKRVSSAGAEFWMAREISSVLGYPVWGAFEPVVKRAATSMKRNGGNPSQHFVQTKKEWSGGNNATFSGRDYFLSRGACYLIAMNGESSKPEIAGAQAYFAIQTRRMEVHDAKPDDLKRLNLRDKVTASMKRVSNVAQRAGVRSEKQGVFHEQRYIGLYNARTFEVYEAKGVKPKDLLFDRAGPLELSAHEFQMNLAANVIENERVNGEQNAIAKNLEVARHVRKTIQESGGTLPEDLPLVEHISDVRKRVTGKRGKSPIPSSDPNASPRLL